MGGDRRAILRNVRAFAGLSDEEHDAVLAVLRALEKTAPRVAAAILRNVLVDVARRLRDAGERLSDGASGASTRSSMDAGAARSSARALTADQLRTIPALASYGAEDLELLAYVSTPRSAAGEARGGPSSMRMIDIDDWDDGGDPGELELAVDPASLRRR